MRYDGYYVLSDLLNRPNLSLAAKGELHRFQTQCLSRNWFSFDWTLIVYGTLAAVYRWVMLAAITVAIVCFTNENSIVVVGWLAAAGLLLWVIRGVVRSKQRNRRQLPNDLMGGLPNVFSKVAMTAFVAGLVWFVCCVPLPRWVYVDAQVLSLIHI